MASENPTIEQLFDLGGRVALVTGASGYLGSAMAEALAEAGSRVIVTSRDTARAHACAEQLPGREAGRHIGVAIDHLDEASIERGFSDAVEQAGQIDILVNNAHEAVGGDWQTTSGDLFTRQLANATGTFLLARKLHDHVAEREAAGSIIMIGSMYGLVASYPEAYEGLGAASPVAYHALKGGIIHMTRHLAVYWAPSRVRVNCLSPGPFPHPKVSRELVARLDQRSPMSRMGQPHELKGAVVFLASQASSYVTGHNLIVDGGWTAW